MNVYANGGGDMSKSVVIPAKDIAMLIESHIMNEFKTKKFKWVMTESGSEHLTVGDVKVELREPVVQKIKMSSQRASEILDKGHRLQDWSSHVTPDELKEISALWSSMPGGTCWCDALIRIVDGQEEYYR